MVVFQWPVWTRPMCVALPNTSTGSFVTCSRTFWKCCGCFYKHTLCASNCIIRVWSSGGVYSEGSVFRHARQFRSVVIVSQSPDLVCMRFKRVHALSVLEIPYFHLFITWSRSELKSSRREIHRENPRGMICECGNAVGVLSISVGCIFCDAIFTHHKYVLFYRPKQSPYVVSRVRSIKIAQTWSVLREWAKFTLENLPGKECKSRPEVTSKTCTDPFSAPQARYKPLGL